MPDVRVQVLKNQGDIRGASFSPDPAWSAFLGTARDMHLTTILPGHTRGNHYHPLRKEVLVIQFEDRWQLKWNNGPGTPVRERAFEGVGAVVVEVERLAAHALRNTGGKSMSVLGICDGVFDPQAPDLVPFPLFD